MRQIPEPYRLSFLVPAEPLGGRRPVMAPAAAVGCSLSLHRAGLAVVLGPSREAVFACAGALLRQTCSGLGPVAIAAVLMTPGRGLCGRDSWTIIVGAEVAFSPTGQAPFIPDRPARGPPRLVAIEGGRDA